MGGGRKVISTASGHRLTKGTRDEAPGWDALEVTGVQTQFSPQSPRPRDRVRRRPAGPPGLALGDVCDQRRVAELLLSPPRGFGAVESRELRRRGGLRSAELGVDEAAGGGRVGVGGPRPRQEGLVLLPLQLLEGAGNLLVDRHHHRCRLLMAAPGGR